MGELVTFKREHDLAPSEESPGNGDAGFEEDLRAQDDALVAAALDAEPDEELINSVKEIGVEEAISVRPRPDGTYGAFKGWRRAQALRRCQPH